jgi:AraC family transcriptional regulator, transcriptional activator of pobA
MEKMISYSFLTTEGQKLPLEIIQKTGEDINYNRQFSVHRHEFIELIWVTKGISTQIVNYKMYQVKANELLIIPERSVHYEKDESYEGFVFLLSPNLFNSEQAQILQNLSILHLLSPHNLLPIGSQRLILNLLQTIIATYHREPYPYKEISLQTALFSLLIELEFIATKQVVSTMPQNKQSKTYKDFILLLEANYKHQRLALFYAKEMKISEKTLNNRLVAVIDKATNQIILERVILEAKRYLSYSNKSIKEIAFELGFEDNHYFSRLFKKKTSYTPKEFRKKFSLKST